MKRFPEIGEVADAVNPTSCDGDVDLASAICRCVLIRISLTTKCVTSSRGNLP